jgi:hypothetical protein
MPHSPFTRPEDVAIEERDEHADESYEEFDRMAFAMSALEVIAPRRMTIAVCTGRSRLRVEAGRSWGRGEGERWGLISIPPNASRKAIVLALAELTGVTDHDARPYALDVLLAAPHATAEAS